MKTCPECAEQVLEEAIVCRYCGHNFAMEGVPSVWHYVGIFFVGVFAFALIYLLYLATKPQTSALM